MWDVVYLEEVEEELLRLPKLERTAVIRAVEKLEAFGPQLGYPHTSAVRGHAGLRELRPRAGRSPWRALYCRGGQGFVLPALRPGGVGGPPRVGQAAGPAAARGGSCIAGSARSSSSRPSGRRP